MRLIAEVAHEILTPLNAVLGFSDVMRAQLYGPLDPRYAECAALIHEAGRHLLALAGDLQDVARLQAGRYDPRPEPIDASEPLQSALRLLRPAFDGAGVALEGPQGPGPLNAYADPRALRQILLNLLSNALKATPRGGSVCIEAALEAQALVLTVRDTGAGIGPEDLERLGAPYAQVEGPGAGVQGSGLGLWIARRLAQAQGGALQIDSAPGDGTAVHLRLPIKAADPLGA